jgi:hypothetical protein
MPKLHGKLYFSNFIFNVFFILTSLILILLISITFKVSRMIIILIKPFSLCIIFTWTLRTTIITFAIGSRFMHSKNS